MEYQKQVNKKIIELISGRDKAFRHFKGGKHIYIIEGIATMATNGPDDGKEVVVYRNIFDGKLYVRSIEEFISEVPSGKENPTGQKYRFERYDIDNTEFINQVGDKITEAIKGQTEADYWRNK